MDEHDEGHGDSKNDMLESDDKEKNDERIRWRKDGTGVQAKNREDIPLDREQEMFKAIKRAHDLAKAVKLDNAEVPKHLWDISVCRRPPSLEQTIALSTLRIFMMRVYCR